MQKLFLTVPTISIHGVQILSDKGMTPVILPPSNAIIHDKDDTIWHDKIVKYSQEKETVYAFSFADLRFIKNTDMV